MKPWFKNGLLRLIAVTCLVGLAFWIVQKNDIFSVFNSPVTLSGSVPEIVQKSQQIKHAPPEAELEILIGLKAQNEAELDALIARQQDPASADYQQFISVDQFTRRFSPTENQVDNVLKFLTANGIKVKRVYGNRLLIHAVANVAQLEKAFSVTINEYQEPGSSGRTYFSNDRDPTLPGFLKNTVQSVIGLNTLAEYQSHLEQPHSPGPAVNQAPLTPQDIATAYNFPNDSNRNVPVKKYSGKGVTLAIATAYGYDRADVEAYWHQHNITRYGNLTDIPINGVTAKSEEETTLDLELAGSQAPGANILMYVASTPAFLNFTLTFAQVVLDNKADVMTVSWGLCEERTGWLQMETESLIFREAAVQGIALFASAGDDGAYDCGKHQDNPMWRVDYPSSSPHVTAIGGTALHVKDGKRVSEKAWDSGGGGVSSHWKRPIWQVAPTLPPGDKRVTTDVSMNADPWTGYSFYFKGKWMRIGGTSASAPEWAALWLLVEEATGQRVGSANYYVYKIGSLKDHDNYFFDVIHGSNGAGAGPGYQAGYGWDIPTGWGTPDATAVIDWMIKVSPPVPARDNSLGEKHPGLMFSRTAPALPTWVLR